MRAVLHMIDSKEYRLLTAGFARWKRVDLLLTRSKAVVARALAAFQGITHRAELRGFNRWCAFTAEHRSEEAFRALNADHQETHARSVEHQQAHHEAVESLHEHMAEAQAWSQHSRVLLRVSMSCENRQRRQLLRCMLHWRQVNFAEHTGQEKAKRAMRVALRMLDDRGYCAMHSAFDYWLRVLRAMRRSASLMARAMSAFRGRSARAQLQGFNRWCTFTAEHRNSEHQRDTKQLAMSMQSQMSQWRSSVAVTRMYMRLGSDLNS